MTFYEKLQNIINKNNSSLCVGIDIDLNKIPDQYKKAKEPFFEYAKKIIDETNDLVCAYKPNSAFFEAAGSDGIAQLKKILEYIPDDIPVILDVKRGDIGNTAALYARYAYEYLNADAVTLSPYMGADSIAPFLNYLDKFMFVLIRTSNQSADEIQKLKLANGNYLYQEMAKIVSSWGEHYKIGFVVGATCPEELIDLRENFKNILFLIPGIGSQGGDTEIVKKYGKNNNNLAIINVSRKIIYPEAGKTIRDMAIHYKKLLS